MAESDVPEPWRNLVFATAHTEFPIKVVSVKKPAALGGASGTISLLSRLQPPEQTGSHVWRARRCHWGPEQLQRLYRFEISPTLVYRFGGRPGPVDQRTWNGLLSILQQPQQQPQRQEQTQQQATAATQQAAVPSRSEGDGRFCSVLLLHVAGRYNDFSIKLILVPQVNQEAAGAGKSSDRVMLWAYFLVLPPFSVEQRIQMELQHQMAPLTLDAVLRALKQSRSQEKLWQSCLDYQLHNQPQENGLPAWMKNVTLKAHLSQAAPRGQLDLVDRCFIAKRDDDRATAAARACDSSVEDACACGYAAAGADNLQLVPLRSGPAEQFQEPCGCPENFWCGKALRRQQLLQLWSREQQPQLEIRRCGGGKGFGLFAADDIPAGGIIGEYCGEVITLQEMDARDRLYQQYGLYYIWQEKGMKSLPPDLALEYLAHQRKDRASGSSKRWQGSSDREGPLAIDATWVGGVMRFINHSCDPNCRAIAVCNGKGTLCLDGHPLMLVPMEACRDISKGEEITFDYSPMEDKDIDRLLKQQQRAGHGRGRPVKQKGADGQPVLKLEGKIKCECGAKSCRNVIFWEG